MMEGRIGMNFPKLKKLVENGLNFILNRTVPSATIAREAESMSIPTDGDKKIDKPGIDETVDSEKTESNPSSGSEDLTQTDGTAVIHSVDPTREEVSVRREDHLVVGEPIMSKIKRGVIAELRTLSLGRCKIVIISTRATSKHCAPRGRTIEITAMVAEGRHIGKVGSISAIKELLFKEGVGAPELLFDADRMEPLGKPFIAKIMANRDYRYIRRHVVKTDVISADRLEEYGRLLPKSVYNFSVDKFGRKTRKMEAVGEFGRKSKNKKEREALRPSDISIGTIGAFFPTKGIPCVFAVSWKSGDGRLEIVIIKGDYFGVTGRVSAVGALVCFPSKGYSRIYFDPDRLEPVAASLISKIEMGGDSRRVVVRDGEACFGSSVCVKRPDVYRRYLHVTPDVGEYMFSSLYSHSGKNHDSDIAPISPENSEVLPVSPKCVDLGEIPPYDLSLHISGDPDKILQVMRLGLERGKLSPSAYAELIRKMQTARDRYLAAKGQGKPLGN